MRCSLHYVIYMKRDGDVQYSVLCVPGWGAAFHPTYISSVFIFIFGIAKKVRVYDVAVISKQVRAPLRAPHVRMHSNAPACLRCVSVFTQMHYTPGSELSGTPVAHLRTGQDKKKYMVIHYDLGGRGNHGQSNSLPSSSLHSGLSTLWSTDTLWIWDLSF